MAFDDEKMIGYGCKGDGSIMFVACFRCPESWHYENSLDFKNTDQVLTWFKREFSTWNENWQEFFSNQEVHLVARPQYYFPFHQQWITQENLTLIGDAAHWMPPFAGEGANVAMQDAFELTDVLSNGQFHDIKSALGYFENDMIMRGAAATQKTLDSMAKMFAENNLEQMLSFFKQVSK